MWNINSLHHAKEALIAYQNYNTCDKHCELPNHICCCHRSCMSKNNEPNNYTQENVLEAIDYIVSYMNRVGNEMQS